MLGSTAWGEENAEVCTCGWGGGGGERLSERGGSGGRELDVELYELNGAEKRGRGGTGRVGHSLVFFRPLDDHAHAPPPLYPRHVRKYL